MELDSYADAGLLVALDLANEPALLGATASREDAVRGLARIVAVDPDSVARLRPSDVPGFRALARALRRVFEELAAGHVDEAAERLNRLLAEHPAHPHLAKEDGRWRMHHHPRDLKVVPMWAATCAEATARMLGQGHEGRFGLCEAPGCGRAFFDVSKNASRRFCSTTCQNRVKAAAFRSRQGRPRD